MNIDKIREGEEGGGEEEKNILNATLQLRNVFYFLFRLNEKKISSHNSQEYPHL